MPELAVVLLVFLAGAWVGATYRQTFVASGAPEDYAQAEFAAAVALACGHGFMDPGYAPTPAVSEFLQRKRDSVTCADLPRQISLQRPNLTQGLYRYLMSAAVLVWMATGVISWSGLTPMFAVAYGATAAAAYGLFRVGIGRVMSIVATVAIMVSALHVGYLPYFRDYAKAPFILTLILLMARLPGRPLTWRRAVGFGIAFGLVLGIGFGFRNDLLVIIVPWAALVLLCLQGSLLSNLKAKALCLALSVLVFIVVAWPILTAYSRGSNSGHVALLGLMSSFNAPLGIGESIYDWGYVYLDGYASALVNSHTYRQYGQGVDYLSAEYDQAMLAYIFTLVRHWPADMLTRANASVVKVLEFPFTVGVHARAIPYGIVDPFVVRFYTDQARVLQLLNGTGTVVVALALLLISARSGRVAVTLLVFLLYFAGYPALQFHVRHFFHLEFIAWWALAYLGDQAIGGLWRSRQRLTAATLINAVRSRHLSEAAVRVGQFALTATLLVAGTLVALRWYQDRHVGTLLQNAYFDAAREPLKTAIAPAGGARVLVKLPDMWDRRNRNERISTEYVIAQFSPERCDAIQVPATFRYDAQDESADFSHDIAVRFVSGEGPTFVFFPAFYNTDWSYFKGIEVPASEAACLAGVFRMKRESIPEVLLNISFTPRWRDARLYQTVAALESRGDREDMPHVYASTRSRAVPRTIQPVHFALRAADIEYQHAMVTPQAAGGLIIKGLPDTPYSPLLLLNNQSLAAGSAVVAKGELRRGGIAIGLLKNDTWAGTLNITVPGTFVALLAVPETGTYTISLSNAVPAGWEHRVPDPLAALLRRVPGLARKNDVVFTTWGWLPPAESDHPSVVSARF